MRFIKIPISLFALIGLVSCATSRTMDISDFRHPIIVSKVRYPGDKGGDENLVSSTSIGNYRKSDEYFISQGQNMTTETKRAVRGIEKPYLKVNKITFEAYDHWFISYSDSSSIMMEVDSASMVKQGEVK